MAVGSGGQVLAMEKCRDVELREGRNTLRPWRCAVGLDKRAPPVLGTTAPSPSPLPTTHYHLPTKCNHKSKIVNRKSFYADML